MCAPLPVSPAGWGNRYSPAGRVLGGRNLSGFAYPTRGYNTKRPCFSIHERFIICQVYAYSLCHCSGFVVDHLLPPQQLITPCVYYPSGKDNRADNAPGFPVGVVNVAHHSLSLDKHCQNCATNHALTPNLYHVHSAGATWGNSASVSPQYQSRRTLTLCSQAA